MRNERDELYYTKGLAHGLSQELAYEQKAQNGALRRPGETWQGTTGVWFYKRPDGKVVRIEPPGKQGAQPDYRTSSKPEAPSVASKDNAPVELSESRGILVETLRKLCLFEMKKLNQLRAQQGMPTYTFSDLRLKIVHPDEVVLSKEVTRDMLPKVKAMAERLEFYNPEFASDYAPVLLASDGKTVVDGNHRAAAYQLAGLEEMLVLVPRQQESPQEPAQQEQTPVQGEE
jgi:hypothetical protein